jgi:hypothetical protein
MIYSVLAYRVSTREAAQLKEEGGLITRKRPRRGRQLMHTAPRADTQANRLVLRTEINLGSCGPAEHQF